MHYNFIYPNCQTFSEDLSTAQETTQEHLKKKFEEIIPFVLLAVPVRLRPWACSGGHQQQAVVYR